jgi:PAS domain S-box-containing protein
MTEKGTNDEVQLLRARVATLEQLLEVHEQSVAEQSDSLEAAIEQLRQHAEQLSRSENELLTHTTILHSILDSMADGVVVADEHGKFLIFNPAAERIMGIGATDTTPDEWSRRYGVYLPDMVTPFPTDELPLVRAIRGESVDDVEIFVRHDAVPEGIWIIVTARPLRDKHGAARGGVCVFRETTERKRTEQQLIKLSRAVDQSANLIVITDAKGDVEYVNPKFTEVTGYTLAEVVGQNPRLWKSTRTPPDEYKRLWDTILAGNVWRGEFLNRKKNGDNFWASASISPVRGLAGEITHFLAVEEDITELKQAERLLRESEERLQAILDNSTAVIYVKRLDRRYVLINKRYETLFHITRDQIQGKTDADLFPRERAEAFWENDRKVLEARRPLEFEEIAPQDDGLHTYISIKFPLFDAAGEPYAICGFSTDITERKRAEEKLMYERYLLDSLMDNVPDSIYFKDERCRFIRINKALAEKNGLAKPADAIGKTDFDFFTPDHAQPAFDDEQEVMRTGQPIIAKEEKETWPDGSVTWVVTTKLPLREADGRIVGTMGISRDITKRKQAEQALRDSEALYHSLVESLPLNVFRKDLEGRLTFANSLYAKTLGRPMEELLGKSDHDLFPKELADKYRADDRRVTETGCLFETVEEHETPRGERLFVQVLKCPVLDSKGKIVGTQVIFWDVTARKRAEEALQNSERRYRQFTEGSQDAIVVANQRGEITLFNAAAQKTFGYSEPEILGQPVTVLMPGEFQESHREGFARYLATRKARVVGRTVELRGRRKNGEIFHLDLTLTALDLPEGVSFLAAIRDTTERHRMQARVMQSEKMASLGMMSAGVAHEINNPLGFVANNLAVLDRDIKGLKTLLDAYEASHEAIRTTQPDVARKIAHVAEEIDLAYLSQNLDRILESTRQGVKRVADIVQNLKNFARVDRTAIDRVDIHDAIKTSLEMIQGRLTRRNIIVEERFGKLPPVACSPAQLNQVFLNLLVNAMQAIEATRRPTGRIEISTRAEDGQVIIEIADDGCGIPPEAVSKIFDPFFTTKKIGEGTGLGLSITHSIVQDHNGEIEVESKPDVGTRFRVILPINPMPKNS